MKAARDCWRKGIKWLVVIVLVLLAVGAAVLFQKSEHRSQLVETVLLKQFLAIRRSLLSETDDRGVVSNPERQRTLERLLGFSIELCDFVGVKCWLHGGTLLGAWRASRIDPWDHDVDFSMLESDAIIARQRIQAGAVKEFISTRPHYASITVTLDNLREVAAPFHFRDGGYWASIFSLSVEHKYFLPQQCDLAHIWTLHTSNCRGCRSRILVDNRRLMHMPCNWVMPGFRCNISNHLAWCPQETKQYLNYYYGPDLSIPQKWLQANQSGLK